MKFKGCISAGVAIFLASCSPASEISTERFNHPAEILCRMQIDASSGEAASFVERNLRMSISGVRAGELYILRGDELTMLGVVASCSPAAFEEKFGISGFPAHVAAAPISESDARSIVGRAHPPRSHSAIRQCIARLPFTTEQEVAPLFHELPYLGLRGVQIQVADGVVYVASDDDCPLLSSAIGVVRNASAPEGRETCANSSLQRCGFPHEIVVD